MKMIDGGVCAAKGFLANGIHCGIRKNRTKRDITLVYSETLANAAAVYTTNLVKGAPLTVTKAHLADGHAQAVICNSGNANTCNANGIEVAEATCAAIAKELKINANDVVVASTGVIGQPLNLEPILTGIPSLAEGLSKEGGEAAAEGIMTTDLVKKEIAVEFTVGGKTCRMGGIAKGSGMIHPNMATMLVFITTDAAISSEMLSKALSSDITETFNMISIDGDTSTNDMVTVLANGMAGNAEITSEGADFDAVMKALNTVTVHLCRMIAGDGEGATKLLECHVTGADSLATAKTVAKSVICSSLLKAAMFGADANWGRVLCAIGYSGAPVDVDSVDDPPLANADVFCQHIPQTRNHHLNGSGLHDVDVTDDDVGAFGGKRDLQAVSCHRRGCRRISVHRRSSTNDDVGKLGDLTKDLTNVVQNTRTNAHDQIAGAVIMHHQRADRLFVGFKLGSCKHVFGVRNIIFLKNFCHAHTRNRIGVGIGKEKYLFGMISCNHFRKLFHNALADDHIVQECLVNFSAITVNFRLKIHDNSPLDIFFVLHYSIFLRI